MAKLHLEQVGPSTYLIPGATNCGIYVQDGKSFLIDSGNDKEAGRQMYKLIQGQGWKLESIICTHSNADHIGGNAFLQRKTGCMIAATSKEACFIEHPDLEPALLYGGFPPPAMRNKFLMAKPSEVTQIIPYNTQYEAIPIHGTQLTAIPLPGHFLQMIGIRTPDNVYFLADSLFSRRIIDKYHFFFLYDIQAHFRTLEFLAVLGEDGAEKNPDQSSAEKAGTGTPRPLFIPSHAEPLRNIGELAEANRSKICEIIATIQSCIGVRGDYLSLSELLNCVCDRYGISMNANQYGLVGSCLRSYISYLLQIGTISADYAQGLMKFTQNYD